MRLLNPFIAHKRLGELYIPGSHDAGAYNCLRSNGVKFVDNGLSQRIYRSIGNDEVSLFTETFL